MMLFIISIIKDKVKISNQFTGVSQRLNLAYIFFNS